MVVHIYLDAAWPKHSVTVANLNIPTDWADTPTQPQWSDRVSWNFEKDGFAGFIVGKFSKSAPADVTGPGGV
jgi:hypothetical protein